MNIICALVGHKLPHPFYRTWPTTRCKRCHINVMTDD